MGLNVITIEIRYRCDNIIIVYTNIKEKSYGYSFEVPVISLILALIGKSILPKVIICGLLVLTFSVFIIPWIFIIYCVYASSRSKMQEIKYLKDGSKKYHISQSSSDRTIHDINYRIKEVYYYKVTNRIIKVTFEDKMYQLQITRTLS